VEAKVWRGTLHDFLVVQLVIDGTPQVEAEERVTVARRQVPGYPWDEVRTYQEWGDWYFMADGGPRD
jgi:hypothetical protein